MKYGCLSEDWRLLRVTRIMSFTWKKNALLLFTPFEMTPLTFALWLSLSLSLPLTRSRLLRTARRAAAGYIHTQCRGSEQSTRGTRSRRVLTRSPSCGWGGERKKIAIKKERSESWEKCFISPRYKIAERNLRECFITEIDYLAIN